MRYFLKFAAIMALGLGLVKPASAQAVWNLNNPVTPQVTLWGVTWAGSPINLFVAVGSKGTVLTSPNGSTWTKQTTPVTSTSGPELYAVTWNSTQNLLVAVGGSGTILTSTNGTSWTQQSSVPSTTPTLLGVTNRGSQYVAVGSSGTIWNSSNGTTWTAAATNPLTTGLNSVAWNSTLSRYAVVGDNGVAATSADGASWTVQNSTAGSNALYTVISTGGVFLTLGNAGTARLTASGSVTDWSTVGTITPTPPAYISSVTFGSELVAVGSNGAIFTSSGGTSWTSRTSNVTGTLNSIAYNGTSTYIAVGNGGLILSAPNGGNTWTQLSSPFVNFQAVDSGAGVRAAVGPGGAIYTSTDDITWTPRSSGTTQDLQAVAWVGNGFVAVGKGGAITVSNAAGTSWTAQTFTASSVSPDFYGVAYVSPTRILAVGAGGYTVSSANGGTSWSLMGTNSAGFYSVAAGPTTIVGVGGDNLGNGNIRLISSLTGTSWSSRPNASKVLYSVVYAGNQFIAVGDVGTIYTSTDGGSNWVSQKSNTTALLSSVTWTGNVAVAVGAGGTVLTSPNGVDWTARTSIPTTQSLNSVTWTGSLITAVGDGGTVITSSPLAAPTVPALVAPASNATAIPVSPRFTWGSSAGGTSYRLQVSTTSSFSALVVDDSTLTGLTGLYGPFALGTKYYWHVRASGPTGTSAYSPTDSFTVASAGTSYPTLSSPANNATDISTATSLNWIAFPGATSYALQFGTDSTFATTSINDTTITGTSKFLSLAINTTYYWRMKATATSGVSAWSPRWTFTTVPNAPAAAPVLASPTQGAIGVPQTTTISWNAVSGATTYHVQVATDSTFPTSAMLLNDSGTSLSRSITGLAVNGIYYWRVLAKNAGGSSAWSGIRTFTTAVSLASKPVLGSPSSGATGVDVFTSFTWLAVTNAVTYQIQVSTDSNFATFFLRDSSLTTATKSAGQLANNTLYYWRVSAKNPAGSSPFSDRGSFTTGAAPTTPPPAPLLQTPAQFAEGIATTTALTWSAAATAKGYRVQVATDALFGTVLYTDTTLTGLTASPSGLVGSSEYFWRVSARNSVGWGAWSEPYSFKTVTVVPLAPTLDAPAAFATGLLPSSVTLSWLAVNGATSYRVQVSTSASVSSNGAFTTFVSNDSVTATSRALPALADNTEYFWHVLARNSAGASAYSATRKFTTGALPVPDVPVLVAPAQFDTGVVLSGSLSWSAVSGANYYKAQLSTTSDFSTPVFSDSLGASATSRAYTNLTPGIYYYWRVAAGNNSGLSAYAARRFTTKSSTAIRTQVALMGRTLNGDEGIRFSVPTRSKVVIRMLATDGSRIAPDYEAVLDRGYYSRPIPAAAKGSFFLVDFQAGSYHQILKIHP